MIEIQQVIRDEDDKLLGVVTIKSDEKGTRIQMVKDNMIFHDSSLSYLFLSMLERTGL